MSHFRSGTLLRQCSVIPPYHSKASGKQGIVLSLNLAKWMAFFILFCFFKREIFASKIFSEWEINSIVEAHNEIRANQSINIKLKWSDFLSQESQKYLDTYGCLDDPEHSPDDGCGENIFYGTGSTKDIGKRAVTSWASEQLTLNDYKADGHHVQILWADTLLVGCGLITGPGRCFNFLCKYFPPGNVYVGETRKPWNKSFKTCTVSPRGNTKKLGLIPGGHCGTEMKKVVKDCYPTPEPDSGSSSTEEIDESSAANDFSGPNVPTSTDTNGSTGISMFPKPEALLPEVSRKEGSKEIKNPALFSGSNSGPSPPMKQYPFTFGPLFTSLAAPRVFSKSDKNKDIKSTSISTYSTSSHRETTSYIITRFSSSFETHESSQTHVVIDSKTLAESKTEAEKLTAPIVIMPSNDK